MEWGTLQNGAKWAKWAKLGAAHFNSPVGTDECPRALVIAMGPLWIMCTSSKAVSEDARYSTSGFETCGRPRDFFPV